MIDKDKVKAFWDARAERLGSVEFESIANLEEDPTNLALKVRLETEKVFAYLPELAGRSILDLGAGVGQWAFRFVDRGAARVVAVEYSAALAEIGRAEAQRRGVGDRLRFVVSPAEDLSIDETFDVVFISGLFVYLTDEQAARVSERLPRVCRPDTIVLLRDGASILGRRHVIDDRRSDHLKTQYSAVYRTPAEYEALFGAQGFELVRSENMFDEGCPLNKYPETRLRISRFARGS